MRRVCPLFGHLELTFTLLGGGEGAGGTDSKLVVRQSASKKAAEYLASSTLRASPAHSPP